MPDLGTEFGSGEWLVEKDLNRDRTWHADREASNWNALGCPGWEMPREDVEISGKSNIRFSKDCRILACLGIAFDTVEVVVPVSLHSKEEIKHAAREMRELDRDGVTKRVEQLQSVAMNYSENPYQDRKMAFGLTLMTNRVGPERRKPVWKKETTAQGQEQAQLQGQERGEEKTRLMTWFHDSWFNCNNRTFIVTKRGYFGLAPPHAQPGDWICVLLTAHVPFVLRRLDERHYSFVGDSYVYGISEGEIFDWAKANGKKIEEFWIR
jgi:hypothetical protein